MVEGTGLENRRTRKRFVGSNPTLPALQPFTRQTVGRKLGAIALLVLPALLLLGFVWSGATVTPVALFGLLLVAVLPAINGVASLRETLQRESDTRMEKLRRETIDAEIFRVAMVRQGRLTADEVSAALGLDTGESRTALDDLVQRRFADIELSKEGVLKYAFHEAPYSRSDTQSQARQIRGS